jgi:hypothetical protein
LQDAQWAWRFAQRHLHVQRTADQRQTDHAEQDQKPSLTSQTDYFVTHPGIPLLK